MSDSVILISNQNDIQQLKKRTDIENSRIYALDYHSHKALEQLGISHEIGDKFLDSTLREKIFGYAAEFHKWYFNQNFSKDFTFHGVNILGMLDSAEFHSFVIHKLLLFFTLKKILEHEQPKSLIISSNLELIVREISSKDIEIECFELQEKEKFEYDNHSFIINIASKPISIKVSRKNYSVIKKTVESVTGKLFNLWYKPSKTKKTVLLMEFNPIPSQNLLQHLSNLDMDVVLFNTRRPAVWNNSSLNIVKKNNIKVLNHDTILDSKQEKEIETETENWHKKFQNFWNSEKELKSIFSVDDISIWPIIQDDMMKIYNNRLSEFIHLIILAKTLFEKSNIQYVLSLNGVGESETAVLNLESNNATSILFEHGFANYTKESAKYSPLSFYDFVKDKIAVWGDIQKEFLVSSGTIKEEDILVVGSTKHDTFFNLEKKTETKSKKIVITLHPINDYTGEGSIETFEKFEKLTLKLCEILNNMPENEILVKLHPGHTETDEFVKNLFVKNCKSVQIHQITPIEELLPDCDLVLNITPDSSDPSTVLLEAMILQIPIIDISIDKRKFDYEYLKDEVVLELNETSDIENQIKNLLSNSELQNRLVENGRKHVQRYLVNPGTASEYFSNLLVNL